MVFLWISGGLLGLGCLFGVGWLVYVWLFDSPYAAKSDRPIEPVAGPERDPALDRPVDITAAFAEFDAKRARERAGDAEADPWAG